jgi:hypothetical protein
MKIFLKAFVLLILCSVMVSNFIILGSEPWEYPCHDPSNQKEADDWGTAWCAENGNLFEEASWLYGLCLYPGWSSDCRDRYQIICDVGTIRNSFYGIDSTCRNY